ncbi:MFS transporter [Evansella sp. AB-P1]|uniref:MFS transporter n=1 Tax=Evansella sp. AB-P1 TaxID=3037653 RepID=UPI00241F8AFC|nr:MFS transporter [Evansella sp. AB-P1]MDG5789551.1 MFS transporter [Evansella sp. AB-P1]
MVRIGLFYFTLFFSFSVVIMYVPLYLQSQGLGKDQIGLIVAMGSIISVIGQPFWGFVSDKIKSTRTVLLFVMIFSLLTSSLFFSANTFILIIFLYTFFMFFMTSSGPLTDSIAMQFATDHNKNYGVLRSCGTVGVGTSSFILGIIIGIVGIQYIGWMYGIIMIVAIPLVFLLYDKRRGGKNQAPISISSVKIIVKNKKYLWMVFITFILLITHKMNDSLFSIYLTEVGGRESQVGLAWMIATFSSVPAFVLTGMLIKRYHEIGLVAIAAFLFSIRWFLYGYFDDPQILIYLQGMQGITFPFLFVAAFTYVTKQLPKELLATGQLMFMASTMGMGGLIGSAGGGWYMEHFSPQGAYLLCGIITLFGCLLASVTYVYLMRKDRREKSKIQMEN